MALAYGAVDSQELLPLLVYLRYPTQRKDASILGAHGLTTILATVTIPLIGRYAIGL
jgi:hypothetical protein